MRFKFEALRLLGVLSDKLDQLLSNQKGMNMSIDDLKATVDKQVTVEAGAVTLLNGLSAQLKAIANDPAKVQALADELTASASGLAAAITANTPPAP